MCNDYRLHVGAGTIADDFSNIKIKIRFPEGTPNLEPRDDIKITDIAPIVRTEWLDAAPSDFADILNEVSAAMDTETLTSLGVRVAVDQEAVEDVAADWLADNGLN